MQRVRNRRGPLSRVTSRARTAQDLIDDLVGPKIEPEVLLAEVEDILTSRPTLDEFSNKSDEVFGWVGRAKSALRLWDPVTVAGAFASLEINLHSAFADQNQQAYREFLELLHQARATLRLRIACKALLSEKGWFSTSSTVCARSWNRRPRTSFS